MPIDKHSPGSSRQHERVGNSRERSRYDREDRRRDRDVADYPPRPPSRGQDAGRDRPRDSGYDRGRGDDRSRDWDYKREDSRRDDRSRGDRRHGLPPPAPSRARTPPPAEDRVADSRGGTPGSGPRKGAVSSSSNPIMAELLKQGKLLASRVEDEADEPEAGELPADAAGGTSSAEPSGRKRKHSPIVWPGGTKQARQSESYGLGGSMSILERSQQEAAALRQMQMAEDDAYDPDGPAALKSSPSISGSDNGHDQLGGRSRGHHGSASSHDDDEGEAGGRAPPKGVSRWLQHDDTADDADDDAGLSRRDGSLGASMRANGSTSPAPVSQLDGKGGASRASQQGGLHSDSSDDLAGEGSPGHTPGPSALTSRYDMRKGCRDVEAFEKIEKISEGMYGVVYKAREKATGRIVALKRVKMERETEGFPITSVREINILLNFHHPNIVNVEEVAISPRKPDQIYMVMEYMDHDLKSLMDDKHKFSQPFSAGQVKCLMVQLLSGLAFLHANWVLHRDLKTSNILYNSKGDLKLCDFGMARQYGEPLGTYTHTVVTLWYRAPELLFGCEQYSTALDVWSVGCIMGELLTGKPMLPGQGELDQIDKIVRLLGTPGKEDWPGLPDLPNYKKVNLKQHMPSQLRQRFTAATGFGVGTTLTEAGFDLLSRLLAWDPDKRISAADALNHRWFQEVPLPVSRVLMPTFAPRKAGH